MRMMARKQSAAACCAHTRLSSNVAENSANVQAEASRRHTGSHATPEEGGNAADSVVGSATFDY